MHKMEPLFSGQFYTKPLFSGQACLKYYIIIQLAGPLFSGHSVQMNLSLVDLRVFVRFLPPNRGLSLLSSGEPRRECLVPSVTVSGSPVNVVAKGLTDGEEGETERDLADGALGIRGGGGGVAITVGGGSADAGRSSAVTVAMGDAVCRGEMGAEAEGGGVGEERRGGLAAEWNED